MLKGKINWKVGNSSEDGLYKFTVVLHSEGGNFLKTEHLSKISLFWHFRRPENRIIYGALNEMRLIILEFIWKQNFRSNIFLKKNCLYQKL